MTTSLFSVLKGLTLLPTIAVWVAGLGWCVFAFERDRRRYGALGVVLLATLLLQVILVLVWPVLTVVANQVPGVASVTIQGMPLHLLLTDLIVSILTALPFPTVALVALLVARRR